MSLHLILWLDLVDVLQLRYAEDSWFLSVVVTIAQECIYVFTYSSRDSYSKNCAWP